MKRLAEGGEAAEERRGNTDFKLRQVVHHLSRSNTIVLSSIASLSLSAQLFCTSSPRD